MYFFVFYSHKNPTDFPHAPRNILIKNILGQQDLRSDVHLD